MSRRSRIVAAIGGAVALALAVTGCTVSPDSDGDGTAAASEITIGTNADANNINPILAIDLDGRWRTDLMFSPLVLVDPKSLEATPGLATSWDVSDDQRSYTFHLDDRATFSDGEPLTSADVEFTVLQMLQPDYTGPYQADWSRLEGAADVISGAADSLSGLEVVDDHTITMTLSQPYAGFLTTIARQLKPLPAHLLEGEGTQTTSSDFSQHPVGSGPYLFDSWTKDNAFVVTANPDYWGDAPSMTKITQLIIPDSNTLVTALETGEIDATIVAPPASLDELSQTDGLEVYANDPLTAEGVYFNMQSDQWASNPKLREAIATAIDYKSFATEFVDEPDGRPSASFFSFASWAYQEDIGLPEFDVEKAKELLAEAGYPDGLSITIITNSGNAFREQEQTYVQQQLAAIGIDVQLEQKDWSEFIATVQSHQYDMAMLNGGDNAGIPDPSALAGSYITGGPSNYSGYSNPEVDRLFSEAGASGDMDVRKDDYGQIQRILATDLPFIPGFWRPNNFVVSTKISGVVPSVIGAYWNIQDWSVQ